MKLFDVDWTAVLRDLARWNGLPLGARRAFLDELRPHGYAPANRFGPSLDALLASGLASLSTDRTRAFLPEERRPLAKVLRAMHRLPLFDEPTAGMLIHYLEEHFTNEEIAAFLEGPDRYSSGQAGRVSLARRVMFAGWTGDLLAATTQERLVEWGEARGEWGDGHGFGGGGRGVARLLALQALARDLLSFPAGVPLLALVDELQDEKIPRFAETLRTGLATLVLFGGMRRADLEPMIGLWPGVAAEITKPAARPPTPVTPVERFELAVDMEDMTSVLAAALATPLRLRMNDLSVFSRTRAAIESRLVVLPEWALPLLTDPEVARVDAAARDLDRSGFAQVGDVDGNPHLLATPAGTAWLASSPHDRLAALVDPIRASKQTNPGGYYLARDDAAPFFPFTLPFFEIPAALDLRRALTSAFMAAGDGFLPVEPFLAHAAVDANPFLELLATSPHALDHMRLGYYHEDPRETYRNVWRNALVVFLRERLARLGGASLGRLANGALCFALTDIGRYLLGRARSFEYGGASPGDVVIQPNFDVVFLGPAPTVEASLARYAERVGTPPGLTFKITRASVLAGAAGGATADEVLGTLRDASSKPLPKNVEREVSGWLATVRRARLRTLHVLECPDSETADRVSGMLGAKARRLTPTVIELIGATAKDRAAIEKRLRAHGVFLERAGVLAS